MPSHGYSSENIRRAAETGVLRKLSNMISLSGLCDRRACRHAQACHGEPRDCLARYAPLVPEDAREGAKAMLDAKAIGLTFEELFEDAPDEIAAIGAWFKAVEASRRKRKWR